MINILKSKNTFIILLLIFQYGKSYGQDTIRIQGMMKGIFLLESFELYPDSTYKWTSDYDLTWYDVIWSEYGMYRIENNSLILDMYLSNAQPKTMSLKDSIAITGKIPATSILEIDGKRIYPLNKKGKRITKINPGFYQRKWAWLFGNRFKYKIIADKELCSI